MYHKKRVHKRRVHKRRAHKLRGGMQLDRLKLNNLNVMADMSAPKVDPRILFGQRLAELRKLRGFSQEGLASESDLARSYIGRVERGLINISLLNICKLAEILEVEPNELLIFHHPIEVSEVSENSE